MSGHPSPPPLVATWRTASAGQTQRIGATFGAAATPGTTYALIGSLGAGKTQFVKGLAVGLGVSTDEPVVSPTFVLVREYMGRLRLFHLDAYRVGDIEELWMLGWEDMRRDPQAVVAVEWADRCDALLPTEALFFSFAHDPQHPDHRIIELRTTGRIDETLRCAADEVVR